MWQKIKWYENFLKMQFFLVYICFYYKSYLKNSISITKAYLLLKPIFLEFLGILTKIH